MADTSSLDAEINALRGEIKRSQPAAADTQAASDKEGRAQSAVEHILSRPDVQTALKDLQAAISEVTSDAEDAITANPLLSVGAAFLLGVVLGRLSSRI